MSSDLCHQCGPVKHEAPTVICAPCAFERLEVDEQIEITNGEIRPVTSKYDTWSLKRLSWAFACAARDSDLEIQLFHALKARFLRLLTIQQRNV